MIRIMFVLPALIAVLTGCTRNQSPVIEEGKLVSMYADLLYLSIPETGQPETETYPARLDSLLQEYGETRERFIDSLELYREKPEQWKIFIDKVIEQLTLRRDQPDTSS